MISLILGIIFGWIIAHQYYKKSTKEQALLIQQLTKDLKVENTLEYFNYLLDNSSWNKEIIKNNEIWISNEDNSFQIHHGNLEGEFRENWTDCYPDPIAYKYPVYLKINNSIIKELTFISIDGGRIFVPSAEKKIEDKNVINFWNLESLRIKVCNVIGQYYIYNDIYGIAKVSKIEII